MKRFIIMLVVAVVAVGCSSDIDRWPIDNDRIDNPLFPDEGFYEGLLTLGEGDDATTQSAYVELWLNSDTGYYEITIHNLDTEGYVHIDQIDGNYFEGESPGLLTLSKEGGAATMSSYDGQDSAEVDILGLTALASRATILLSIDFEDDYWSYYGNAHRAMLE